jgi:hypothetical protein
MIAGTISRGGVIIMMIGTENIIKNHHSEYSGDNEKTTRNIGRSRKSKPATTYFKNVMS